MYKLNVVNVPTCEGVYMKKLLVAAALGLPLLASAQLVNGSFETGDLTGWTVTGAGVEPASVLTYGPGAAYGETVLGQLGAGNSALYLVEDAVMQTVSQDFNVAAAFDYDWSFSFYLPNNGFANVEDTTFSVSLGGNTLFTADLSTLTAGVWYNAAGTENLMAGMNTFAISIDGMGKPAKDVVFDNAMVTAVPEPESYALMLAGLAAVTFVARRRARG